VDSDWKPKEIKIPDLLRINYGIHERQTRPYSVESKDGSFFVEGGPPFLFQILLYNVNSNIKSIQLKKCLLINSIENNLLELDDISIEHRITFADKNYEGISMSEKEDDYSLFHTSGIFYKGNKIEELILKSKEIAINEFNERHGNIVFLNIPIDYLNDENITIKVEFLIVMEDEKEIIFNIDENYLRKNYRRNQ
jgi:hypothetical protein